MKYLTATLLLAATVASADHNDGVIYYAATNGVEARGNFMVQQNGTNKFFIKWDMALPQPTFAYLKTIDAAAASFVATSEQFQVVGVVDDTNTIKTIRQELRAIKGSISTNRNELQATAALTNGFTQAELRTLVNALRREGIDAGRDQRDAVKAQLDLLRDGQ